MNRLAARSPANRCLLYPQKRTFRGPRWTSGFDPERTSSRHRYDLPDALKGHQDQVMSDIAFRNKAILARLAFQALSIVGVRNGNERLGSISH